MTQFSFAPLNSKPSFPKTLLSASKANTNPKERADIIYENPNNFPKLSAGKNTPYQESVDHLKSKSIDEFLKNSAKKSVPLADLPLADLPYYNRRASHDSASDDLEGFSSSSEARTTPNKKGKHSPARVYISKSATKNQSRYQQDLGSTAYKTPVSKDWFQETKEHAVLSAPSKQVVAKPRKMSEQRKLDLDDHEDEINQEFEEETQAEENVDQNNESRNMRIGLASTKKDTVKRYNVFEDWRIMESVDFYIQKNGTKGILSKSVWEKLVDPETGGKVLSESRTPESMRERYKRWLRRMTPEDRKEITNFVRNHPEEYIKHYNCMFDLAQGLGNSEKKSAAKTEMAAVNSDLSYEEPRSDNLFSSPPAKQDSRKNKDSAMKTPKFDNNLLNSAGSFEKSKSLYRRFEEHDGQTNHYSDDIQNFEDLAPVERHNNEALHKSRKPESIVKKNFSSKETNLQVQDVSGKKRLLNVNLYEETFNNEETNDVHHTKKIKADSVNKSTQQVVRTIHKATPTNKPMEEEEVQQVSQELGSELEEIIKSRIPKKLEDMNLNITIHVDDVSGERIFIENPREIKSQPKLVQLAKAHNMELNNLLQIFYSLSNDYKDLENLLEHGDDSYVWTPIDDKGLLENDPTVMHYLKRIKGDERIQKRKMFLLREI